MHPKVPDNVKDLVFRMSGFQDDERRRALDTLHKFYNQSSPLPFSVTNHTAFTVVWKGLHTAMLRQDQPLLQEALADKISSFIHCFKKEKTANLFIQAAMETFEREWDRVNQFMVDKMMMLFRRVIRQAIFRLADQNWLHSDQFVQMLEDTVIRPLDHEHKFGRGPKLHLSSIYLEELAKGNNEALTHDVIMVFLRPYIKVLAVSHCQWYVKDVITNVFHHLLRQSDVGVDNKSYLLEGETLAKPTDYGFDDRNIPKEGNDALSENESEDDNDEEVDIETDEGVEMEQDEEDLEEGEEEEEEFPLDPRAGNVDVLLPQLRVNYEDVSGALFEVANSEGIYKKNHAKLMVLVRQFMDVVGGVYPLKMFPEDYNKDLPQEELNEVDVDKALDRALKFREREYAAVYRPRGGVISKRNLETDKKRASKVSRTLSQQWLRLQSINRRRFKTITEKSNTKRFKKYSRNTDKIEATLEKRRLMVKGKKAEVEKVRNKEAIQKHKEKVLMKNVLKVTSGFRVSDKN
ncbi:ribosomal RNA processing protein 1 homolog A [Hyalella azteca]|uniref:Ribosomal RNA processing protein 1 homolog A n=1 Tax=Hyalella azteca TaxID=294128 RepID=A0A8B7N0I1_HYAAZ|nr:ribosomal RNA processing protein 1 homolog A [Hyalella azteca]